MFGPKWQETKEKIIISHLYLLHKNTFFGIFLIIKFIKILWQFFLCFVVCKLNYCTADNGKWEVLGNFLERGRFFSENHCVMYWTSLFFKFSCKWSFFYPNDQKNPKMFFYLHHKKKSFVSGFTWKLFNFFPLFCIWFWWKNQSAK